MTKTDLQLKHDIEAELLWDPKVNAAQIGVTVNEGAVSLLGTVDTYAEKQAAEDATKRVAGVRTIAQELAVKILGAHAHTDSDIAAAVQNALKWNVFVPKTVYAKVHQGRVTLEGEVTWNFQRESAESSIRYLIGVVAIYNSINLKPQTSPAEVKEKIQSALKRQAIADTNTIHVHTAGGKVTLSGHASSWQSIEDATNAAWGAAGVTEVSDEVKIQHTF